MTHWTSRYVGKPWAPDGAGPARFSCWGLVRAVFLAQRGIDFPEVAVSYEDPVPSAENVAAIKQAATAARMRPLEGGRPQAWDIVLMRSPGHLHCGVVLDVNGRPHVLHSAHAFGVTCEAWRHAVADMETQLWRQAA